jgi:hypothetical protein
VREAGFRRPPQVQNDLDKLADVLLLMQGFS